MRRNICTNLIIIVILFISIYPIQEVRGIIQNENDYAPSRVLITGFGPFATYAVNPSQCIAEALNGTTLGNTTIIGITLPVKYNDSIATMITAIQAVHPQLIISIGLAPKARLIRIENSGINLKINESGSLQSLQRLDSQGKVVYQSTLPTQHIVQSLREQRIPARQSWFAGVYVCNALLYKTIQYLTIEELPIKAGFIHVPPLPSQASYGMEFETMIDAVRSAITTSMSSGKS